MPDLYTLIGKLNSEKKRYAVATVVRRINPSSGKPGDQAIITVDGTVHGWIGGGCTRGIALKEALAAIQDGQPRFVRIGSEKNNELMPNTKHYTMTCQSGGSVDVFIQPVLPRPRLIILGRSHIGMALARLANAISYQITVVNDQPDPIEYPAGLELIDYPSFSPKEVTENSYLVVCTQGQADERALEVALSTNCQYISFVSSRRKAAALFGDLRKAGYALEELKRIKTPAGLDLNAKLPEEVAISILAEIVQDLRAPVDEDQTPDLSNAQLNLKDFYINPVCGIPVQKSTAKHTIQHHGEAVYFCCDGCKEQFEANPAQFQKHH